MSEPDYSRLREGLCPVHGTPLDRRDDHGWCDECDCGWSLDANKIKVHITPKIPDVFKRNDDA